MSEDKQDMTVNEMADTPESALSSNERPQFRIIDGGCPALECELPQSASLHVKADSFMAKSPSIAIASSAHSGFELYHNEGTEAELLYLTAQMVGSFMMFDLSVHRHGLVMLADSLFAYDEDVECQTVLDVELGTSSKRNYKLFQVTGQGQVIAFMGGDLFPLSLQEADSQQVQSDLIAAIEPSVSFDLTQLDTGHYVANLNGPGRIWLQSMAQPQIAEPKPLKAPSKGGFFTRS